MINEIAQKLGFSPDEIVTSPKSLHKFTFKEILNALLQEQTLVNAAKKLNISRSSLQTICLKLFPNKNTKQLWSNYLHSLLDERYCNSCQKTYPLSEFPEHKVTRYICKKCTVESSRIRYQQNIEAHKKSNTAWRKANPDKVKANDAKRRARENNAWTKEANQSIITAIYQDCFDGYHVDHIIPISKGGLHHENNLCWLPASLNMAKSNKMPEEVPEIMKYAIYPNLEAY